MSQLIKKTIVCAGALTLMIAQGVASAEALSGFIYSANERGPSISEIALATGEVRTFKTSVMPHNEAVKKLVFHALHRGGTSCAG